MRRLQRLSRRLARPARWAALGIAACLAGFLVLDAAFPFPVERLERWPVSPEVRARGGELLFECVGQDEQWRRPVPLADVSPWVVQATLAAEDERFHHHFGVDPLAVLRAALQNVASGRVVSGASTLHMQVARMCEPRERGLVAKGVEAFRAVQLHRRFTREEVLETYLNIAPYGGNVRGVEAAARRTFGKAAGELSLAEAALLAGLPQSPTRYDPRRFPDRALQRRQVVLARMLAEGFIDRAQYRAARATPLTLARHTARSDARHVARWALERRPAGGRTTIDAALQGRLANLAEQHARALPAGSEVACVVLDVERAEVRACLGSLRFEDEQDGQVDAARARRSPGSTLKPFVYAAALEARLITPDSVLDDTPLDIRGWRPENFDGRFSGRVRARDALRRSLNVPAVRLAAEVGLGRCAGVMTACGVELPGDAARRSGLSLVLGATEVRLVDLVNAYATLARGGRHEPPRLFADEPSAPRQALAGETCAALFDLLAVDGPTRFMWKSGTSAGHRDAWAVGHDGRHAVGVWVGDKSGAGRVEYVGADAAGPLLVRLFEEVLPAGGPGARRPERVSQASR